MRAGHTGPSVSGTEPLVLGQAAGFAFLAAVAPTALLVGAVYLGSADPRKTAFFYLVGAVAMTTIAGLIVILAVRAGHLDHPHQRAPRYSLRLGLGVAALAAAVIGARRKPEPPGTNKKPGLVTRLIARPSPLTAFTVGIVVFAPSATYVAAASVIGTAKTSDIATVGALAVIVVIDVLAAWVPYVLYLVAPDSTTRKLKLFNNWLAVHGRVLAVGALVVAGVILTVNGILGLTGVV